MVITINKNKDKTINNPFKVGLNISVAVTNVKTRVSNNDSIESNFNPELVTKYNPKIIINTMIILIIFFIM